MSIVAVRNGVIAADTESSGNSVKTPLRKLYRRANVAIGWAGYWADGRTFAEWFFDGADMDNLPMFHNREGFEPKIDFCAIVLQPHGWEYWSEWFVPQTQQDIQQEFYAIGSGAPAALAAMHMGANAIEACEIACRVSQGCAGPIMSEEL